MRSNKNFVSLVPGLLCAVLMQATVFAAGEASPPQPGFAAVEHPELLPLDRKSVV